MEEFWCIIAMYMYIPTMQKHICQYCCKHMEWKCATYIHWVYLRRKHSLSGDHIHYRIMSLGAIHIVGRLPHTVKADQSWCRSHWLALLTNEAALKTIADKPSFLTSGVHLFRHCQHLTFQHQVSCDKLKPILSDTPRDDSVPQVALITVHVH